MLRKKKKKAGWRHEMGIETGRSSRKPGYRWAQKFGSKHRVEWFSRQICATCMGRKCGNLNIENSHVRHGHANRWWEIIPQGNKCHMEAHSRGIKTGNDVQDLEELIERALQWSITYVERVGVHVLNDLPLVDQWPAREHFHGYIDVRADLE